MFVPSPRSLLLATLVVASAVGVGCASDPDDAIPVADAGAGEESGDDESGDGDTTDTIPRPDELEDFTGQVVVTVDVRDNTFRPRNIRVDAGTQIVFELTGRNAHNVLPGVEGMFPEITDPDLVAGGDDSVLVVDTAGDVPYYCSLHGTATVGMTGFILVE